MNNFTVNVEVEIQDVSNDTHINENLLLTEISDSDLMELLEDEVIYKTIKGDFLKNGVLDFEIRLDDKEMNFDHRENKIWFGLDLTIREG